MGLRKRIRRAYTSYQINQDLGKLAKQWNTPLKPSTAKTQGDFIVSLTSHPPRFKTLPLAIKSIVEQNLPPKKIILNLYEGDITETPIPKIIQTWASDYFSIELNKDNLRSHLKYYNTFKKHANENILIADDDITYMPNLFGDLWKEHERNSRAIICGSNRGITFENGKFAPYQHWQYAKRGAGGNRIIMCTSGVLFPSNSLSEDVLNKETFMKLSETNDDLWLTLMAKLKDTPISGLGLKPTDYQEIYIKNDRPLWRHNKQGADDKSWNMLTKHYKLDESYFLENS